MGNSSGTNSLIEDQEKLYNACKKKVTMDRDRQLTKQEVQAILGKSEVKEHIVEVLNVPHGMNRCTVLHEAAMNNNLDVVKILLEACTDSAAIIDTTDSLLHTALHKASKNGYEDIVKVLLEYDANEKAKDMYGRTPLDLAQEDDHKCICDLLRIETRDIGVPLSGYELKQFVEKCKNELKALIHVRLPKLGYLRVRGNLDVLSSVKAEVERAIYNSSEVPTEWKDMEPGQVKRVHLMKDSSEYQTVEKAFTASLESKREIISIEHIQNPSLYLHYKLSRIAMINAHRNETRLTPDAAEKAADVIERHLFHGTAVENIDKINLQGFNRNFAGENAALYGKGVYFAVKAEYSTNETYSKRDRNGRKHMYWCCVLTGSFTAGNSGMKAPPPKNPAKPEILYDSVVNNLDNIEMFIVFNDTQAYPEYLITFC